MTTAIIQFDKDWFKLPLVLRQRWWAETDYGKKPPSPELTEALRKASGES